MKRKPFSCSGRNASRPAPLKTLLSWGFRALFILALLEVGWRLHPERWLSVQQLANSISLRQEKTFRILCVGASMLTAPSPADCFPARLESLLNGKPGGLRISVINRGRPGTDSLSQLKTLEEELRAYRPDLVLVMTGLEDDRAWRQRIPQSWAQALWGSLRTARLARSAWRGFAASLPFRRPAAAGGDADETGGIPRLEGLVRAYPRDLDRHLALAAQYCDAGMCRQAAVLLEKAAELAPDDHRVHDALAAAVLMSGDTGRAERLLGEGLRTRPECGECRFLYGWLCRMLARDDEAERHFRKALSLSPRKHSCRLALALLSLERGACREADDWYHEAFQRVSGTPLSPVREETSPPQAVRPPRPAPPFAAPPETDPRMMGDLYLSLRRFDQAEKAFADALRGSPGDWRVYLDLARLYRIRREYGRMVRAAAAGFSLRITGRAFVRPPLIPTADDRYYRKDILRRIADLYVWEVPRGEARLAIETVMPRWGKEGRSVLREALLRVDPKRGSGDIVYPPSAERNLRAMKRLLDARGIRLACVQYPLRSVAPLRAVFGDEQDDVLFVGNDRSFRKALRTRGHRRLFSDRVHGDFGHLTAEGCALAARNTAEVVLRAGLPGLQDKRTGPPGSIEKHRRRPRDEE